MSLHLRESLDEDMEPEFVSPFVTHSHFTLMTESQKEKKEEEEEGDNPPSFCISCYSSRMEYNCIYRPFIFLKGGIESSPGYPSGKLHSLTGRRMGLVYVLQ